MNNSLSFLERVAESKIPRILGIFMAMFTLVSTVFFSYLALEESRLANALQLSLVTPRLSLRLVEKAYGNGGKEYPVLHLASVGNASAVDVHVFQLGQKPNYREYEESISGGEVFFPKVGGAGWQQIIREIRVGASPSIFLDPDAILGLLTEGKEVYLVSRYLNPSYMAGERRGVSEWLYVCVEVMLTNQLPDDVKLYTPRNSKYEVLAPAGVKNLFLKNATISSWDWNSQDNEGWRVVQKKVYVHPKDGTKHLFQFKKIRLDKNLKPVSEG